MVSKGKEIISVQVSSEWKAKLATLGGTVSKGLIIVLKERFGEVVINEPKVEEATAQVP
jgi:hypothetical protein